MEFHFFDSIYTLLVGFGFVFSHKSFRDKVKEYSQKSSLSLNEKIDYILGKIKIYSETVKTKKISIEDENASISNSQIIDDVCSKIEEINKVYKAEKEQFNIHKQKKEDTSYFNILSFCSAFMTILFLFFNGILRGSSGLNKLLGYEVIFIWEFLYICLVFYFFLKDYSLNNNSNPMYLGLRYVAVFSVVPVLIITAAYYANIYNIPVFRNIVTKDFDSNIFNANSYSYKTKAGNLLIIGSIVVLSLHYALYYIRIKSNILFFNKKEKKIIAKFEKELPLIDDEIKKLEQFNSCIIKKDTICIKEDEIIENTSN